MTDLGPPLFFWVMLAAMLATSAWGIVSAFRRRAWMAVASLLIGIFIGITIWYFDHLGAFCVAPAGSGCA